MTVKPSSVLQPVEKLEVDGQNAGEGSGLIVLTSLRAYHQ